MVAKRCCCPSLRPLGNPDYLPRLAVGAPIDADDMAFNLGALLIHRKELNTDGITDRGQIGKLPLQTSPAREEIRQH